MFPAGTQIRIGTNQTEIEFALPAGTRQIAYFVDDIPQDDGTQVYDETAISPADLPSPYTLVINQTANGVTKRVRIMARNDQSEDLLSEVENITFEVPLPPKYAPLTFPT